MAEYRKRAMELLKKYSSSDELDPQQVLSILPEEWELATDQFDLIQYLMNIFNRLLIIEENQSIAAKMSNMEILNKEKDLSELKEAYLVIDDSTKCKVCKRIIDSKQYIKIYPNGGVYHS